MQYFCRVPCFVRLKQYIFLFALSRFLLFLRESWQKYIKKFLVLPLSSYLLPPLVFAFWRGEKCHRNHFFLLLRAFFSFFLWKKQSCLSCHFCLGNVIFCWQWRLAILGIRSLRSRLLSVIKVFQSLKSTLQYSMKISFTKKGSLWVKILVL